MWKYFAVAITSLALFLGSINSVMAATRTSGNLEISFPDPLFSSDDNWYPGFSLSHEIRVKNNNTSAETIVIKSQNQSDPNQLAKRFNITIADRENIRYGGADRRKTLLDFFTDGDIILCDISPGQDKAIRISIMLDSQTDDASQSKELKFDFNIGFLGKESVSINATDSRGNVDGLLRPSSTEVQLLGSTTISTTSGVTGFEPESHGEVLSATDTRQITKKFFFITLLILLLLILLRRIRKIFVLTASTK